MKKGLFYFICLLSPLVFAQDPGRELDSLTKAQLGGHTLDEKQAFVRLIIQRNEYGLYERLDSCNCELVFIEESYHAPTGRMEIKEKYFCVSDPAYMRRYQQGKKTEMTDVNLNSLFPDSVYIDDHIFHSGNRESIDSLFIKYLMPSSEVFNCMSFSSRRMDDEHVQDYEKQVNGVFKNSYKIYSLVDKKQKKTLVVLQKPAKKDLVSITYDFSRDILLSPHGW